MGSGRDDEVLTLDTTITLRSGWSGKVCLSSRWAIPNPPIEPPNTTTVFPVMFLEWFTIW